VVPLTAAVATSEVDQWRAVRIANPGAGGVHEQSGATARRPSG
jgi:hypothetical protein